MRECELSDGIIRRQLIWASCQNGRVIGAMVMGKLVVGPFILRCRECVVKALLAVPSHILLFFRRRRNRFALFAIEKPAYIKTILIVPAHFKASNTVPNSRRSLFLFHQ